MRTERSPDETTVTAAAVTAAFRPIPRALRHTLTLDNGREFIRFLDIEKSTGLAVYFADPYSAWQRGTNENTNGLLRRYFPKGSDFRNVTPEKLAAAMKILNHRPASVSATGLLMRSSLRLSLVRLESEFTAFFRVSCFEFLLRNTHTETQVYLGSNSLEAQEE